jgi:hypothetical protein
VSHLDDDPYAVAEGLGLEVVLPGPRDVFVDIDVAEDLVWLHKQVALLDGVGLHLAITQQVPSKGGLPRQHVYLVADRDLTPMERIALQACLGSDRKREILSIARTFLQTDRAPTLFFEREGFEVTGIGETPAGQMAATEDPSIPEPSDPDQEVLF